MFFQDEAWRKGINADRNEEKQCFFKFLSVRVYRKNHSKLTNRTLT